MTSLAIKPDSDSSRKEIVDSLSIWQKLTVE